MDEAELEDWFSEKKELLETQFQNSLLAKVPVEKAKPAFDARYRALIAKYQHRQERLEKSRLRKERMHKPFVRFREWRSARSDAFSKQKERTFTAIRKFFFDIKLRWILRK